ncbi:MAG: hypothetical protein LPK45_01430 [Bacteroidota bacterium]|nr:hypothetical protein [Bacteroidota bacterium]MDX5429694.1 hypothetical protein [Bacteroidota bacterium]MDX5468475.1 hypothetical protein [Bacteroidota bacterium]
MEKGQNQDKSKALLIVIIIILLIMNGFFIFHYVNTDKELTATTTELTEVTEAREELDKLLKETEAQVDGLQGQNAGLDSLLSERNKEIQEKAAQIELLLKDKKNLAAAREEIQKLRYYVKKYQDEIASLTAKNEKLQKQNREIQQSLDREKERTEDLTMKTIVLENKVNLGKKLSFTNMEVQGMNKRSSGRETETTRAKRVDLIKVTFTLDFNYVADLGAKRFYLRIITPEGVTLSNEQMGGGTFRVGGEDYLFTMAHEINFDNTGQNVTFYYDKGDSWESGMYKAEIYADGFLIGSQDLKLR